MMMMIIILIRQWALSTPGAIHFNFLFKSAYSNEHLTPRHWYIPMKTKGKFHTKIYWKQKLS
jgi:type IV secretory pathway VirB3-like protein